MIISKPTPETDVNEINLFVLMHQATMPNTSTHLECVVSTLLGSG
jgi:hypothetical protein